jgi:hypothetical protein
VHPLVPAVLLGIVGAGLNFACMGEDGLGRLEGKHPVIVYAANPPTRQGF